MERPPIFMLSGEGTGQVARDKAVHDLYFADVARVLEQVEHRKLEDQCDTAGSPRWARRASRGHRAAFR
jgi:hypothetical protein